MHIISVTNSKGGSGKTTLAVNLAATLAEMGHRSVLIDMDPQNHCASSLAIPTIAQNSQEDSDTENIDPLADRFASAFLDQTFTNQQVLEITEDQCWQMSRCLKVMPAGDKLNHALFNVLNTSMAEIANQIRQRLHEAFKQEAFIIIDTASSQHPITQLINRIAHRILIPVNGDYLCLESAAAILNQHQNQGKQRVHWVGMNMNSFSPDSKRATQRLSETNCLGMIAHDKVFIDAVQVGRSAGQLAPESQAAQQVKLVAEKIIHSREYADLIPIFGGETRVEQSPPAPTQSRIASNPRLSRAAELVQRARELTGRGTKQSKLGQPAELKLQMETDENTNQNAQPGNAQPGNTQPGRHFGVFVKDGALRFTQPIGGAEQMAVVGNFGHTGTEIHPMIRNEEAGVWEAQILVNPGEYHYQLVVNGELASDPYNAPVSRLGSRVTTRHEANNEWQKTA